MAKFLKKIGRCFIAVNQKCQNDIRQSVLLVDGSFILPNNFALIIKDVKERFKNANLTVLTFRDKEDFLKDNFSDIEIIIPNNKIKIKKYELAIEMLRVLRRNFNFIILSSLDISPLLVSLLFTKCPVFLHNRWLEWYKIKLRTIGDILRRIESVDENRRQRNCGIKYFLKSIGRIFVLLTNVNAQDAQCSILIEDNGSTDIGHVSTAVLRATEIFVNPDITILTFAGRKHYFVNMFPQIKVLAIKEPSWKYALAIQMFKMRKLHFDRVVLTTLDVSPIPIAFLFMKTKVLLYNRWHQWWSLSFRVPWDYFKELFIFIFKIPLFIYLLFMTTFILLRMEFRLMLLNLKPHSQGKNRKI